MSAAGFSGVATSWSAAPFRWLSMQVDLFRGSTATATATEAAPERASARLMAALSSLASRIVPGASASRHRRRGPWGTGTSRGCNPVRVRGHRPEPAAWDRGTALARWLCIVGARVRAASWALFVWTASVVPASAWVREVDGSRASADTISLAASTPDGVIAAGRIERGDAPHFAVVAFDGASGAELWRWESDWSGEALAVAADANGVVATGQSAAGPVVVAFRADGTLRWQAPVPGSATDGWRTLSLAGDAVVAGRAPGHATVAAYSPAGTLRWRYDDADAGDGVALVPGSNGPTALLALDAASAGALGRWRVRALDGATGAERWRETSDRTVGDSGSVTALVLDGRGDVVAAGHIHDRFEVRKHDGQTGALAWRQAVHPFFGSTGAANAVAVTGTGDVLAGGLAPDDLDRPLAMVVRLDGTTGEIAWEHPLGQGSVASVAAAPDAVVVGGSIVEGRITSTIVASLDAGTGDERWRVLPGALPQRLQSVLVDSHGDAIVCLEYPEHPLGRSQARSGDRRDGLGTSAAGRVVLLVAEHHVRHRRRRGRRGESPTRHGRRHGVRRGCPRRRYRRAALGAPAARRPRAVGRRHGSRGQPVRRRRAGPRELGKRLRRRRPRRDVGVDAAEARPALSDDAALSDRSHLPRPEPSSEVSELRHQRLPAGMIGDAALDDLRPELDVGPVPRAALEAHDRLPCPVDHARQGRVAGW